MAGEKTIKGTKVRVIRDDITDLECQAFVYYAQHDLKLGSGYGTAISTRGGPAVQKELDEHGSLETTEAVVTGAGNMKAEHIVHAVGPRFQEEGIEPKLRATCLNVLERVEEKGIKQIAFTAMGCGYYGIPRDLSSRVTVGAIKEYVEGKETGIEEVIICVTDHQDKPAFDSALESLV